jgi:hypothetical protein
MDRSFRCGRTHPPRPKIGGTTGLAGICEAIRSYRGLPLRVDPRGRPPIARSAIAHVAQQDALFAE